MPGFSREWAQFEHARRKNAQLLPFEPYALWRHDVVKHVEPGAAWQPTGVPKPATPSWAEDPSVAGKIAERAFDLVRARLAGAPEQTAPLPDHLVPALDSLFITVLAAGRVHGCMGGKISRLDDDLRRLAGQALVDPRFLPALTAADVSALTVTVALLSDPRPLGPQSPDEIAIRYRHGEQALVVFQGTRTGLLLPFVVVQQSLTPQQYVLEVIDKAGITRPPYFWGHYDVHSWLADGGPARLLAGGLPPGPAPATLAEGIAKLTPLLAGYLGRHGTPEAVRGGLYRPMLDRTVGELDLPRQLHALHALARAGRVLDEPALGDAARAGLDTFIPLAKADPVSGAWWLPGPQATLAETTFLLLGLCELGRDADRELAGRLADTLWARIDRHGRVAPHLAPPAAPAAEDAARAQVLQDFLPAQVLLALAVAAGRGLTRLDRPALERALRHYRHRFRYRRHLGHVCWLPPAAAAAFRLTGDPAHAALAFEVADWVLGFQQEKSGGFLGDLQPDAPGYSTGVFLEGVAAALALAHALGDGERAARYRRSATRGLAFLDTIVYQERDRALLPDLARALGGVRMSRTASDVRLDFVAHALSALLELRALA